MLSVGQNEDGVGQMDGGHKRDTAVMQQTANGFIAASLWLGQTEGAFVDLAGGSVCRCWRDRRSRNGALVLGAAISKMLGYWRRLPTAIVAGWPWNWRRVVGMKT